MKRIFLVCVCSFAMVSFLATSASAQDAPNRLDEQPFSLSFGVPSGGNSWAPGAFGIWKVIGDGLNLGVNIGMGFESTDLGEDTGSSFDLLLAPAIKYYTYTNSVITPYLYGQLNFRTLIQGNSNENVDSETDVEVSLAGGFGVEWFPVPMMSIGGQVGIGIDIVNPGDTNVRFGTFTSGLSAQFYFR